MIKSRTYIAAPPGATIKEQLLDKGLNQKKFAIRMDMSEKHISRLINGEIQLPPMLPCVYKTSLAFPPISGKSWRQRIVSNSQRQMKKTTWIPTNSL